MMGSMTDSSVPTLLRLAPGPVDLTSLETDAAPGVTGGKAEGKAARAAMADELADLQERLWAERTVGSERRILLVLQGMDTSGKGGTLRHTVGLVDPQGVRITSFKAPTEEEKKQDFLERIERAVPEAGYIGVFDRSHYEDVLIARVRGLADEKELDRRYDAINEFEDRLAAQGTTIIKVMLHISADEQKERLQARLANPAKHWKYNPGDLDERELWPAYREAYEIALERTSTQMAPWYVVPSDKKWYRNLAVGHLLLDVLRGMNLSWPEADFDVEAEKERLARAASIR
jgi:PPK2 family polyphosphate:nucleotide phosphotransferase